MSHLPASPTARRREEELRQRARLEAIEAKVDLLVAREEGVSPSLTPTEDDVKALAEALARGDVSLPRGTQVGMTTEVEIITGPRGYPIPKSTSLATAVQLQGGPTWTVRELLERRIVVGRRWLSGAALRWMSEGRMPHVAPQT